MSWSIVRLEELYAEPSRNGIYKSKEYQGTGTPVVKMNELFDNRRIHAGDLNLDRLQLSPQELQRFCLNTDDLLFARTSVVPEGVGKCSLICSVEGDLAFGSNLIRARIDESKANPAYLFYYFQSPSGRGRILAISNGVAVRTIRGSDLKNINIKLPRRKTQEHIASILSSYDDLIENNLRRIQLLEQAARLLYKEWFVHLRFPGHERVSITDGVPEGWERKQVKNILGKVKRSRKIKKAEFLEEGAIPCIDQSRAFIGGYTDDEGAVIDEGKPVIVFGDHTRILKFVDFPFARGADGTQLIVPNDEELSEEFLYFALEAIDLSDYSYARHFKFLKDQYIPRPPSILLSQFTDDARPIMKQIKLLRDHSRYLAQARDLLLPRLMNGEVVV